MDVVSYFEPINFKEQHWKNFSLDCGKLQKKWHKNWSEKGWNPIFLNEEYARKHHALNSIDIDDFKSNLYKDANSPLYAKQCYLRWFAYCRFAEINNGAHWSDYDVYNCSLRPKAEKHSKLYSKSGCAGYMSQKTSRVLIENIFKFSKNQFSLEPIPSCHDMQIVQKTFRENYGQDFHDDITSGFRDGKYDYQLYHLHGGVILLNDKLMLHENRASEYKSRPRSFLWDFLESKLKP